MLLENLNSHLFHFFNSIISFAGNSKLLGLDINNDQDRIGHIAAFKDRYKTSYKLYIKNYTQ